MDDRRAQFLIAVGDLCAAAGLAGLQVEMRSRNGDSELIRGVPYSRLPTPGGSEPDYSRTLPGGSEPDYSRTLYLDDRTVRLEDIWECTIYSPSEE